MTRLDIYPLRFEMGSLRPDRTILVARAALDGEGRGQLDVFVPTFENRLRPLFEQPQEREGQVLQPWSPEALDFLLKEGLAGHGLAGEVQR